MVYPYFNFFLFEKRSGMLVNKGSSSFLLFEKVEVRYQVAQKLGICSDEVVSLQNL